MLRCHIIEGAAGCAFAVEHGLVAVVVDALRASATAAMLFDAGARELIAVRELDEAYAARKAFPDALVFGERGGLPQEDFDSGNSPRTVEQAAGRRVIFTTTTGAGRLVESWGAAAIYMGSTVNASALVRAAARHGKDVVLVPAGLMGDPAFDAQEDWVAAAAIAMAARWTVGEGAEAFEGWRGRIEREGLLRLFETAPHAGKLRAVGLEADVPVCAAVDLTGAVPVVTDRNAFGVVVHDRRAEDQTDR